jgi:serine/threonine-protein kinase
MSTHKHKHHEPHHEHHGNQHKHHVKCFVFVPAVITLHNQGIIMSQSQVSVQLESRDVLPANVVPGKVRVTLSNSDTGVLLDTHLVDVMVDSTTVSVTFELTETGNYVAKAARLADDASTVIGVEITSAVLAFAAPQPTPQPTPEPTPQPTPEPTPQPTPAPTAAPTAVAVPVTVTLTM